MNHGYCLVLKSDRSTAYAAELARRIDDQEEDRVREKQTRTFFPFHGIPCLPYLNFSEFLGSPVLHLSATRTP
jgi:hypothetical protein